LLSRAQEMTNRPTLVPADAAERHVAEVRRVSAVLAKAAPSGTQRGSVPSRERLSLTAAHLGDPLPEIWYPLSIYLHLQANEEQVRQRISEQQRQVGRSFDAAAKQSLDAPRNLAYPRAASGRRDF
jgi:hypothetical protein